MREATRFLGASRALFGLLGAAAFHMPRWLMRTPRSVEALAIEKSFFARLLRAAAIRPEIEGAPAPASGTLYVANHASWADIVLLGALLDADFVSKEDVGRWPLVGRLARRFGTLFVARDRRGGARVQAQAVRARLHAGRGIILFPEGGTSDGTLVLPFRTSLFAAAEAASYVQPIAIRYVDGAGHAPPADADSAIVWRDGETMLANAARIARHPRRARVRFLPPLDPAAYPDRKALADAARSAIDAAFRAQGK